MFVNVFAGNSQGIRSTVEFVVNTDTFIHNDDYDYFTEVLVPYVNTHSDEIETILLIGSASPEGNVDNNIWLANKRADKIYSYIKRYIPRDKITIDNDYSLFLDKTGLDESDYGMLRATYIEVRLKQYEQLGPQIDTVYVEKVINKYDTIYVETPVRPNKDKLVMSLYNNLVEDFVHCQNLGVEVYFNNQTSWFMEGSFSRGTIFGRNCDADIWTTGVHKYFNDHFNKYYVELYIRGGYYDTNIIKEKDIYGTFVGCGIGVGYKFNICSHWKVTPCVRFGFDNYKFMNYYQDNSGDDMPISFDIYTDGRQNNTPSDNPIETNTPNNIIEKINKNINKDFYNNCSSVSWFGPTYIGITIQRDFYRHNK